LYWPLVYDQGLKVVRCFKYYFAKGTIEHGLAEKMKHHTNFELSDKVGGIHEGTEDTEYGPCNLQGDTSINTCNFLDLINK